MARSQLRSFLSLIALLALIGGTIATTLGLMKVQGDPTSFTITEEEFIVPAIIGNSLCVIFLVWLTATIPSRSTGYKFTVIIILVFGIIGEIYLTLLVTKTPAAYGTYVVVVANFLIRTFFVLEYVQDTWSPISWSDTVTTGRSSSESKPTSEKKPEAEKKPDYKSDPKYKESKDKLRAAIDTMKSDSKKFDTSTDQKAFQAFSEALRSGKSFDEAYKTAKSELKYEDGSAYTGAGRRHA